MEYKLGQSYLLPVKEVISENKRTFYKVEAQGKNTTSCCLISRRMMRNPKK